MFFRGQRNRGKNFTTRKRRAMLILKSSSKMIYVSQKLPINVLTLRFPAFIADELDDKADREIHDDSMSVTSSSI